MGAERVPRRRGWMWPVVAGAIAVLGEIVTLQLWSLDLRIPILWSGDAAFSEAVVRGFVDGGHLWTNARLGAPGTMNLLDYPSADLLHYALIRLLALLGGWAVGFNLYFLLGFPLAAASATWVARRLGVSGPAALAAGVLYAFLPYHMWHSAFHVFLSAYYLVPLVAWLAIELVGPQPPLLRTASADADPAAAETPPRLLSPRAAAFWLPIAICLLAGSAGVYYAFYGAIFILAGGVIGWWRHAERSRLIVALTLVCAIALSTAANLAPFVWHTHTAGANEFVADRNGGEADLYGLQLAETILPSSADRVGVFALERDQYEAAVQRVFGGLFDNEAQYSMLGFLGVLGFLALVWWLVAGVRDKQAPGSAAATAMARLNIVGVLMATVGGFGAILAVWFPEIRATNRIVVYLGFFALVALGILLDRAVRDTAENRRDTVLWALAILAIAFGLYEQTSLANVPPYPVIKMDWQQTSAFVGKVQSELPAAAMVYQLPYVPFPENPPVLGMDDYDHFRPYMVSSTIHWSYGAVKGRPDAIWDARTSQLPPDRMVAALRAKGFSAIWVDTFGYKDGGAGLLCSVARITGHQPQRSVGERYAFVKL
jgi:phosphoglycerol transferase